MAGRGLVLAENEWTTREAGQWDGLVTELLRLRTLRGEPSYASIAAAIAERRIERGATEHAARVPRSTVHDAFRLGRSRINVGLTREIVAALDGDPGLVDTWLQRVAAQTASSASDPVAEPPATPTDQSPRRPTVAWLLLGCVALNLVGREFVDLLRLPMHLDMVGTAIAAIAVGPWRGAAVGLATNVLGVIGSGFVSLPFALVNMAGALVWGYGVHRYGLGRTLPRFFVLNLIVALVCSLVAIPVAVALLGGELNTAHSVITESVRQTVDQFLVAVGIANVLVSLGDKLISGFIALVVIASLPLSYRRRSRLAVSEMV